MLNQLFSYLSGSQNTLCSSDLGSRMQQETFSVIHERMKQLWPEVEIDWHVVLALICGSAAAFLGVKWVALKRINKQIQDVQKKRELGLEKMEKTVQKFKLQVYPLNCACEKEILL